MKMCRLEEVACEFRGVGCDGCFLREDQENHARENSDKHLTLTASLAVETKDSLIKKLLDQDERHKEEKKQLREKIIKQEQQLTEQQEQLTNQQQQIKEQQGKVDQSKEDTLKLQQQLQGHVKMFAQVQKSIELNVKSLEQKLWQSLSLYFAELKHSFVMTDFSIEKLKDKPGDWKSPAMYTHAGGLKFCIGVDANGSGVNRGKSISVNVWAMPGGHDNSLKWPAQVQFNMNIINKCGPRNVFLTTSCKLDKPINCECVSKLYRTDEKSSGPVMYYEHIIEHSDLHSYLHEDSLHFKIVFIRVSS